MRPCMQAILSYEHEQKDSYWLWLSFDVLSDILRISTQNYRFDPKVNVTSIVDFHTEAYLGRININVITTVDFYSVTDM